MITFHLSEFTHQFWCNSVTHTLTIPAQDVTSDEICDGDGKHLQFTGCDYVYLHLNQMSKYKNGHVYFTIEIRHKDTHRLFEIFTHKHQIEFGENKMLVVEKLKEYKNKERNFRESSAQKVVENFKQYIPESLRDVFEFANVCVNGYLLSANVKVGDVHFFMFYHYDKRYYEMVFENEPCVWTSTQSFEELVDCILSEAAKS